jgi:acetoacetate decarboxylase
MGYGNAAALTVLAAALAGCAAGGSRLYDSARIDDPQLGLCTWSGRYKPPIVYQESDHIRGYFEAADLAAYRQAIVEPFAMPERPLVRVSVIDFYGMENGPSYLESEVSVLVNYKGELGWLVLTMPVTDRDACSGGRNALGTPKIMRRITLERSAERYVGTSYARGGAVREFTLTMQTGEPGAPAREVLNFISPIPDFYLLGARVLKVGGLPRSVPDLERLIPSVWKVRLGEAQLDFPGDPGSLLRRLRIGRPLAAYWGQMRYRFTIVPREAAQ